MLEYTIWKEEIYYNQDGDLNGIVMTETLSYGNKFLSEI